MRTEPLRIAVLASHGGSNMQAIMDRIASGRLNARIVLLISNNSQSGAIERVQQAGLPWRHLSSQTHPDPAELDQVICEALVSAGAELIVLAGYMKKIGLQTLRAFKGRILNIHPALLPRHGGPGMYGVHPHESVLASGDGESGATVHVIDENYDQGKIIAQRRVPVMPGDTPQSLQQRVLAVEHEIYADVIGDIVAGKLKLPLVD